MVLKSVNHTPSEEWYCYVPLATTIDSFPLIMSHFKNYFSSNCRYYSGTIIRMSGVESDVVTIWLSAAVSSCSLIGNLISLYLVAKVGRRTLALGSLAGIYYFQEGGARPFWSRTLPRKWKFTLFPKDWHMFLPSRRHFQGFEEILATFILNLPTFLWFFYYTWPINSFTKGLKTEHVLLFFFF